MNGEKKRVVSKILCKPPLSGKIETDNGGFNYGKKRKQQIEGSNAIRNIAFKKLNATFANVTQVCKVKCTV